MKIIVVDNGSTDGTVDDVREMFPNVDIIENGANLGFAEGTNVGIRRALKNSPGFVFLVNNDALVEKNAVASLIAEASEYESCGIFGCAIRIKESPEIKSMHERRRQRHAALQQGTTSSFVESVIGCGMFIRREVFETIGLLDPTFFAYYEDTDFCSRARRAGFGIRFVASAIIHHETGGSTGGIGSDSRLRAYFMGRNQVRFWRLDPDMIFPKLLAQFCLANFVTAASTIVRENPSAALAKLIGMWEGLCQSLGAWPRFPKFVTGPQWTWSKSPVRLKGLDGL